jgi:hypothetical protein
MDVSAVPCVAWGVHRVGLMKRSVSVAMRKIAGRPAGTCSIGLDAATFIVDRV